MPTAVRLTRLGAGVLPALLVLLAGCSASWKAPLETRGDSPYHARRAEQPGGSLTGRSYRVRRGDTLYSIAWRAGHDFRSLARWNGIRAPYTIYPGQTLRLTPPARTAHTAPQPRREASSSKPKPKTHTASRTAPRSASPPERSDGSLHWRWPTDGPLLEPYSAKDPTRTGIKIGGKLGQPVRAAEAGRVVYSGSGLIGYGRLIIIKHNDNYLTAYGHNAKLLVKEGEQVARGSHIADMGRSNDGRPMLHFEMRREGSPVDPLRLLPRR